MGPHTEEVIDIFALAIRHGLTFNDLKATMLSTPTGWLGYRLHVVRCECYTLLTDRRAGRQFPLLSALLPVRVTL